MFCDICWDSTGTFAADVPAFCHTPATDSKKILTKGLTFPNCMTISSKSSLCFSNWKFFTDGNFTLPWKSKEKHFSPWFHRGGLLINLVECFLPPIAGSWTCMNKSHCRTLFYKGFFQLPSYWDLECIGNDKPEMLSYIPNIRARHKYTNTPILNCESNQRAFGSWPFDQEQTQSLQNCSQFKTRLISELRRF